MSLRLRLVLWYTGVLAASACVLTTTLYALVAHRMRSEVENDLEEEIAEWREMALAALDDLPALERQLRIEIDAEGHFPLSYRLHDVATGRDVLFLVHEDVAHLRRELAALHAGEQGMERDRQQEVGQRPAIPSVVLRSGRQQDASRLPGGNAGAKSSVAPGRRPQYQPGQPVLGFCQLAHKDHLLPVDDAYK
jgi:hypothetical protein